jgi:inhibitor of KinA
LEKPYSIVPLNESAVVISFGNGIDPSINQKVISLYQSLQHRSFHGFIESVPAYSSLAVFYSTREVTQNKGNLTSAFGFVKEFLESALLQIPQVERSENQVVEIPVLYSGQDLMFVAASHQLTPDEVIAIHTATAYRVFMIGFLPGFPYLGTVDARIATPRKSSPRTSVPPGSLGIAGFQTGIYPQPSPGGWQLIGKTPLKIFDKQKTVPCLFRPGDSVRFYAIDQNEFEKRDEY